MKNHQKNIRSLKDRLASCEFHLITLWEATQKSHAQPERYKQIAADLRILLCRQGMNKPILLDLMREFKVQCRVVPLSGRILLVGWRYDKEYIDAYASLQDPPSQSGELIRSLHQIMPPGSPLLAEDYIERGSAIGNEQGEYSYKQLILSVSQQIGGSHEDETVDKLLESLGSASWINAPEFLRPLVDTAHKALCWGAVLYSCVAQIGEYKPRYLQVKMDGDSCSVTYPGANDN